MQKLGSSSAGAWVNMFFYPCIYLQAHTYLLYSGLSFIIQTQLNQNFIYIYIYLFTNENTYT